MQFLHCSMASNFSIIQQSAKNGDALGKLYQVETKMYLEYSTIHLDYLRKGNYGKEIWSSLRSSEEARELIRTLEARMANLNTQDEIYGPEIEYELERIAKLEQYLYKLAQFSNKAEEFKITTEDWLSLLSRRDNMIVALQSLYERTVEHKRVFED